MKQYDVKISHAALSDMEQIYSYIADRLLEPDTAIVGEDAVSVARVLYSASDLVRRLRRMK